MTQKTIAPYATAEVLVPYGQKIAISTNGGGIVTIWYGTAPGISPERYYVQDRINNEEVLLGTFSADQKVKIDTKGSPALYDIGTSPSVGSGDADTLGGQLPAYYATDSLVLHLAGSETITGAKTFPGFSSTSKIVLDNDIQLQCKTLGGTARGVVKIDTNDIVFIGNTNNAMNLRTNGTLQYNGSDLASGTIDTTATQTITVEDGLITAIA